MTELASLLKELMTIPGVSGYEGALRSHLFDLWQPLTDEISVSPLGSLHGLRRGAGSGERPALMVSAHMDTIGLMVTGVNSGFLNVTEVGGLDVRVLPGQPVTVHGRRELAGLLVQPASHLIPIELGEKPVPLEYLLVDVGLEAAKVGELVRVGDFISFAQEPIELSEELIAGPSLDNRVSVAALTILLEMLKERQSKWDVWAVATVQEEETMGGALTSAFALRPSLAVAIDVTHASFPGSPEFKTFPLSKGPTLEWSPSIHPALHIALKDLAERLEIPYQFEPVARPIGTESIVLQVTAAGIPTMVLGIPIRYMHTPVEVVSLKDVQRTARLTAEFIFQLDEHFLETISWE